MPTVSILVTVYNREQFLGETLASVLASTYRNFELIVVDDTSSDGSVRIAEQFAERDSRIHVHENEKNLGDYPNRMRAASLARGRYLKYVDSDDIIYPHSLAVMVEGMAQHPDAALGLAHSMPEDESPYPWRLEPEQAYRKHFLGRGCLSCGPSGAIIRRDAFETVGGFNPNWGVLADIDLWYRLAARSPVVLLPPGLVWWRRHEGQEFSAGNASIEYLDRGYQLDSQALGDPDCPLDESMRAQATGRLRQHFARRLLSLALKKRQPATALRLFRQSDLTARNLLSGLRAYSPPAQ